jgi:hypothetical protein
VPPVNVRVIVDSSPRLALIGVWLSKYVPVKVYLGEVAVGVTRPAAVGETVIVQLLIPTRP